MSMLARVAKLEGRQHLGGEIPVWCDQPTDMPGAVAEMIADGEITESDRSRCVFWAEISWSDGSHEHALTVLS